MAAAAVTFKTGNILAKQRKKEQEDSAYVFPKLTNVSHDMILNHEVDDTYSKSSYSKDFDALKDLSNPRGNGRPNSSRRNRPHPRKDWLMWRAPEEIVRKLRTTDDGGLWIWSKNDVAKDRYETEYSRLYAGAKKDTAASTQERKRLLNREEVARVKLPAFKEYDQKAPTTQPNNLSSNTPCGESYSDLNKYLGSDIWKDKEVLNEVLNTADKRYLIKFLKTLSPETLFGLKKWLMSRDEEKDSEEGDTSRWPLLASPSQRWQDETEATPPSSPNKDQNNGSHDYAAFTTTFESKSKLFSNSPSEASKKFVRNLVETGDYKQIEQFLSSMIQPEAVSGVTHWLVSHDGQDREVALRFLGEVRFKPNRKGKDDRGRDNLESPSSNILIRHTKKKRNPHGKNCSCTVCDVDHSNKILRALYKQGTASVVDEMRRALEYVPRPKRFVMRQQNQRKNQVPKLGGDNLVRHGNPGYVANKNALFMQPHRTLPSHFVIHPELP